MSKNDIVLLDAIIDERINHKLPSENLGEVFEFFSIEQLLKDYELPRDKLLAGWIDGNADGGIDGIYIFINGNLYLGEPDFVWPKTSPEICTEVISCKHHAKFEKTTIDTMFPSLQEFFDLSLNTLRGKYSDSFHKHRKNLINAYKMLARYNPTTKIRISYASRGDTSQIGDEVEARRCHIVDNLFSMFSKSEVAFNFVGATELISMYRKIKILSLSLPFIEQFSHDDNNYVVIAKLLDYYTFISDENGDLRRYLFESNVRDFLGYNAVNSDIEETLSNESSPNFWWLNNGVTILGTNAHTQGKNIYIENVQIVNGLQTTETIYRHFRTGSKISSDKNILIKIITTERDDIRKSIIKATNNQSNISQHSLHATDKIQRDIEDILLRHDFYYIRREHYYKNEGKNTTRFVEPLYVACGVMSLIFKRPDIASGLKNRFMRNQETYGKIFSERFPIEVWPAIVIIYKQIDLAFIRVLKTKAVGERAMTKWRGIFAFCTVSLYFKTFAFSITDLITLCNVTISDHFFTDAWEIIHNVYMAHRNDKRIHKDLTIKIASSLSKKYGVIGLDDVYKNGLEDDDNKINTSGIEVKNDFVSQVHMLLPKQPWPIGIHKDIASKLCCHPKKVLKAIDILIREHKFCKQFNGIVYNDDGNAIAVDKNRCPHSIEEINAQNEK